MNHLKNKPVTYTLFITLLFCSSLVFAQTSSGSRHSIGGFVGFTDRSDTDFTFGGEYEYRMQGPWSVGTVLEYTPDAVFNDDFITLLGTINYRPVSIPRLKFTGGAGVEFKDFGGDDLRVRLGSGYDIYQGTFTLTPRVAVDFGDGDESVILGLTLSRNF